MKSKFQIVSGKGEIKNSSANVEIDDLNNEEMLLQFLKQQIADLEDYVKLDNRLPIQKAVLILSFGDSETIEESLRQFQYLSYNISTPDFFLLVDFMKTKYIQDISQS